FRPISLIGSLNKLISKVLFARIQPLVKSIISYHQFAGVKGRQSHEANFIANEVLDSRKRSGKPGLILKLDIEKAFDSVNWNCLFNIVRSMGFNQKFHKWIKGIVSQSKLSVLVNGEATGFFSMERGLEQGDSLSPFLFNLVMDILAFMLDAANAAGLLSGFYFDEDRRRGEVSHILYADDAVIFCDATEHEVTNLLAVLLCFQSVTGLKVNLEKSKLFPVGEVPHLDRLADLLCCDWDFLPTIYLGLPLGASPTSGTIWNPLISRVQSRLQGWKGRFLSIGGRLVLIKSVLASQPTYLCSLYRAPTHVVQTIEKLQCSFLWSGSQEQNKFHLVSWDRCKQPKKWGGLGIPDFKRHNTALLSKWWWKFACGDSWWKDLMRIKYPNEDSQWMPGKPLSPVGCSPWSQVYKVKEEFWKFAVISPGSGDCISFWRDRWVKGVTLADCFPRGVHCAFLISRADSGRRQDSYNWGSGRRFPIQVSLVEPRTIQNLLVCLADLSSEDTHPGRTKTERLDYAQQVSFVLCT
ncbi:unnamed protein product, partial [Linum tenue]